MSRIATFVLVSLLVTGTIFAQASRDHIERYIDKYKELAITEMQRTGIPASIKLGQALIESDAGRSDLARKANNHFGIKCNTDWEGKTFYKKDDDYNDQGEHIESCFRVYEDAEASFRGHSEFLLNPRKQFRYGQLFELDPRDYRGWAEGLRRAGYATNPSYSKRLIEVIERHKLYKYDHMTVSNDQLTASNDNRDNTDLDGFMVANDVKYVLSRDNEPISEIAKRTHTPVRSLLHYNENLRNDKQRLEQGTRVYLQAKRNTYRGKDTYHTVQLGETMFEIAQEYGLKLEKLYQRNRMEPGMEPAYNERIKLRGGKAANRPTLVSEVPELVVPPAPPKKDTIITTTPKPTPPPVLPVKETPPAENKPQPVTVAESNNAMPNTGIETTAVKPVNNSKLPGGLANARPQREDDFDTSDIFESKVEAPAPKPLERPDFHTVAKGDTLWNISQRYNLTVSEVKALNNLSSDSIKLGQKLRVR
ncbi:MAG: glucosaminidase domain-containing protein [Saprospiraceae bacterium]